MRVFGNTEESIASYFRNINSHQELRKRRLALRAKDEALTGYDLIEGLHDYSKPGQAYIDELSSVMSYNKLGELNNN